MKFHILVNLTPPFFTGRTLNLNDWEMEQNALSELTEEELRIYNILVDYIISQATEWKNQFDEKNNFPRWATTWLLSLSCKEKAVYLRKVLSSIEKKGLVEAERRPNHISWSPMYIPGFKKHHQFRDYMEPLTMPSP